MNPIAKLEIHSLANLVPIASPEEQRALELDIAKIGQQTPIILYRGKIVDGRCRALACLALKIAVKSETLPNNLTITEVADKVKSLNTRRNLTKSQKAIIAAKQYIEDTTVQQKVVFESWGVGKREFTAANYLLVNRPDYADALFAGKKAPIGSGKFSHSVRTVADAVVAEIQKLKSTLPDASDSYSPDFTNLITTAAGRQNYEMSIKRIMEDSPHSFDAYSYDGNAVRKFLAEIADHFTAPVTPPVTNPNLNIAQPQAPRPSLFVSK